MRFLLSLLLCSAALSSLAQDSDGNRIAYLDRIGPYYVGADFAKMITPQWIGEEGVDAVVVLSIDDMREHPKYEEYLRPILDRLMDIDGRAPVSIFTCFIKPDEAHLQTWMDEGVNLDIHTVKHPCPFMAKADFNDARETYEQCVDIMANVPRNSPAAFRMPCCDSLNTPSPRFYAEVFNKTSPNGEYLTIDSSVFNVFERDADIDFRAYIPFDSFVNTIVDYPYPYLIGAQCWEVPCTVPSDWEGHNRHGSNNPITVDDMSHAIDLAVAAKGVYVLVFHPHGWIRNNQVNMLIDHTVTTHGSRVKFLQFGEIAQRLQANVLAGQPLRDENGRDNGVRILDLNNDGYMDVVVANDHVQMTRVWNAEKGVWADGLFPFKLVSGGAYTGARFGIVENDVICVVRNNDIKGSWRFHDGQWSADERLLPDPNENLTLTALDGADQGVRFRDLDGDGDTELIVAKAEHSEAWRWDGAHQQWAEAAYAFPDGCAFVDAQGRPAGLRLHDLDGDGTLEVIQSNASHYAAYRLNDKRDAWIEIIPRTKRNDDNHAADHLPPFDVHGENWGAWFHSGHIWWRNEYTAEMPDHVDRRSFQEIVRNNL